MTDDRHLSFPAYRCLKDDSYYYLTRNPVYNDFEINHAKGLDYEVVYTSPDYDKAREKLEDIRREKHLEWE